MRPQTGSLKRALGKTRGLARRLALLENAYRGETCYLVSCGPSLNEYDHDALREYLAGELVIAVKQAYDILPGVVDFHLLNSFNMKRYRYTAPEPIILLERGPRDPVVWQRKCDLRFTVPDGGREDRLLAHLRNFDDHLFTKRLERPWGPGIVYELGFYLAVHLGVARIRTIGWDLGKRNSEVMPHFFAEEEGEQYTISRHQARIASPGLLRRLYRRLPLPGKERIRNAIFGLGTLWPHLRGRIYNRPLLVPEEVDWIADSTKDAYLWLQKKGIALEVISQVSLVDPIVPRVRLPIPPG